jgi:GDP-D-mannose 3',5'-epimerase
MNSDYNQPLNICSNRLVTIDELASMIIGISCKKLGIRHESDKPQGVRGRTADLTLVRRIAGWEPKVSLEEGLRTTYDWISKMVKK